VSCISLLTAHRSSASSHTHFGKHSAMRTPANSPASSLASCAWHSVAETVLIKHAYFSVPYSTNALNSASAAVAAASHFAAPSCVCYSQHILANRVGADRELKYERLPMSLMVTKNSSFQVFVPVLRQNNGKEDLYNHGWRQGIDR